MPSKAAKRKAREARTAAWDLNDLLHSSGNDPVLPKLGAAVGKYREIGAEFARLAEKECA